MLKTKPWIAGLLCLILGASGCGAVPDSLLENLKTTARTAIQEAVRNTVTEAMEDMLGGVLDADLLPGLDADLDPAVDPDPQQDPNSPL